MENVIYMIPDGFNADYATNYRLYKGKSAVWDKHLKGMYSTHSADSNITDSAAAEPSFLADAGWQGGIYGMILSFAIIIVTGYLRPVEPHVEKLWKDIEIARSQSLKNYSKRIKKVV